MTQAERPAGPLPAGVTSEMVEAALAAYESKLLDLHSTSFEAAEPISVSEIRSDCIRAALTAALAGRVVVQKADLEYIASESGQGLIRERARAMLAAAVEGEAK